MKITSFYSLPVLLFALQACNSGSPLGEGGYSPGEVDAQDPIEESGVPADWIEIAFFEYALRVPPDITRHRSIGIDSETQTYSSSQFSFLIFDGMIPLVTWDEDAPGLVEERLTLDSVETAVMATYGHPHDGYNIRLQIEDAGTIRPLRFRARCETEAQCQNIHKMLRTLRTLESTEPGPGHPPTTTFIDEVLP